MSRSRRHVAICGHTYCRSEKRDKQTMHRMFRVHLRIALANGDWERAMFDDYARSHANVRVFGKDGKGYFGGVEPKYYRKLMRK